MSDAPVSEKARMSATVDAELLAGAQRAVAEGQVSSVSAWVNEALQLKAAHERRLAALDSFITGWEAEHGEVTEEEMTAAARRARQRAIVVRSAPTVRGA